ncbi:MAG: ribonuclease P protein component [Gammaproteobacteria bacterium]
MNGVSARDEGFPSSCRLARRADFRRVLRSSERSAKTLFTVIAAANGLGFARLAVSVPRRHVRAAVLRNRFKRIVRETFRRRRDAIAGKDWMVLVHSRMTYLDLPKLRHLLETHWQGCRHATNADRDR